MQIIYDIWNSAINNINQKLSEYKHRKPKFY